jgi:hypothetical protein
MEAIMCLLEDEAKRLAHASSLSPYFFNTWRHFEGEIVGLAEGQVVEYHPFEPDCGCEVCQYYAIEPRPRIVPIRTPVVTDPGATGDWTQAAAEISWIDFDQNEKVGLMFEQCVLRGRAISFAKKVCSKNQRIDREMNTLQIGVFYFN